MSHGANPYKYIFAQYITRGSTDAIPSTTGQQIRLYNFKVTNRANAANDLGILKKFSPVKWDALSYTAVGPAVSSIGTTLKAGTASTLYTTTVNDGFVVQNTDIFNLIGMNISQAESGTPVYTIKYWNGSAWATLPVISTVTAYSTGVKVIAFATPLDWVVGAEAVTGLDQTKYSVLLQATTVTGTAVKANSFWLGQMIEFAPQVADDTSLSMDFNIDSPKILEGGESIFPYYGTAHADNLITAIYTGT